MFKLVEIKEKEGIVIVKIRQNKGVKWDAELMKELQAFIKQSKEGTNTQVIIFVQEKWDEHYTQEVRKSFLSPIPYLNERNTLFQEMENLSVPTIAVLEGGVSGDYLEFCFMCDFRVIEEDTQLNFCFENGGLPSYKGIRKVSQLVGEARAKELFFTSKILSARVAVQIGLGNKIAVQERLMAESIEFAKCIKLTGTQLIDYVKGAFEVK